MARKKASELTPSEWKVMKIVWQLGSGAARDIYTIAGEKHDWAPNTVKKFLSRLVDKGFLTTTQIGNSYLYKPARSPLRSLRGVADSLLDNAVQGTVGPLLAYMVRKSELSAEDVNTLQSILENYTEEEAEADDTG